MGNTCCGYKNQKDSEILIDCGNLKTLPAVDFSNRNPGNIVWNQKSLQAVQTFGIENCKSAIFDLEEDDKQRSSKEIQFNQIVSQQVNFQEENLEQINIKESVKKVMHVGIDVFIQLKRGAISDFYETCELLGEGAFGKVWKVIHKSSKMIRAMKQIKKAAILKEDQERLFSEMNILKNLDHPHIVKLYEIFEDDKNYYLITEHCSGGELFDKIKSMSFFSENKAAGLMKQILMAVVYVHAKSIVHRDLKPENILFISHAADSNLKIIDFGTSRKFDPKKQMTKRLGTVPPHSHHTFLIIIQPYYIAPEVLNEDYNEKCDVWSCGVILFILLCGYPPFSGKSETEIMQKIKLGKFYFDRTQMKIIIAEDWDHISQEAKTLISKMLTLNPAERMTSEQALNDPWIQLNAPTKILNKISLFQLKKFQVLNYLRGVNQYYKARSKFKQALMTFIATQILTQQDQEELQNAFHALDLNGDGMLSQEELIKGYTHVTNNQEAVEQVKKIMVLVDINNSGKVDFTEFIIAAMHQEKLLSLEKMKQAFKIIDLDGDNYISKQELEYNMGGLEEDVWQTILIECDSDNDGKISLEEFIELLTSNIR